MHRRKFNLKNIVHLSLLAAATSWAKTPAQAHAELNGEVGSETFAMNTDMRNLQSLPKISVAAARGSRDLNDVAATVSVIDSGDIERELSTNIRDLIRYEPGVSVANSPARFGLSGFNIRGVEGNRVSILIDGAPMNDAFSIGSFSDARRNLVDLDSLKSVEIVRGSASALYGSNAIGGVVSLVTKDPLDYLTDDRHSYIEAKSGYQSDTRGWLANATTAFGNRTLSGLLFYSHHAGHEVANQGEVDAANSTRTKPNPQDFDGDSVLAKLLWQPNEHNQVRLTVDAARTDTQTNVLSSVGAVSATTNTLSLAGDDEQQRTRISLEQILSTKTTMFDTLEWRIHHQQSDIEQKTQEQRVTTPSTRLQRDRGFDFEQIFIGGELTLRKQIKSVAVEQWFTYGLDSLITRTEQMRDGVQTNLDTRVSTSNIPPDNFPVRDFPKSKTEQYALYVQDEILFAEGRWRVIPGVRVDHYQLTPEVDDIFAADNPGVATTELDETSISPKLGLIWKWRENVSSFVQYAHGFRAPPYNDVNIGFTNLAFGYTAIANPDLKSESSDNLEVGMRGNSDHSDFSVALFYSRYSDFIESLGFVGIQNGLQVFQSRNVADANIYGVEARTTIAIVPSLIDGLRFKASVAYAHGEDSTTDQPINSVDPLKGVFGVAYQPKRWGIELLTTAVQRKSDSRIAQPSTGSQFVPPGYVIFDLLAHANFGEHVRGNVGVFNLTDRKYWDWTDVRGQQATGTTIDRYTHAGINASASISVNF